MEQASTESQSPVSTLDAICMRVFISSMKLFFKDFAFTDESLSKGVFLFVCFLEDSKGNSNINFEQFKHTDLIIFYICYCPKMKREKKNP